MRVYWGNLTLGKMKREETEATEKLFKLWYRSDTNEKIEEKVEWDRESLRLQCQPSGELNKDCLLANPCVGQKGPGPYRHIKLSHWLGLATWELGLTIMCWGRSWRHCSWMLSANCPPGGWWTSSLLKEDASGTSCLQNYQMSTLFSSVIWIPSILNK